MDAQFFSVYLF